MDNNSTHCEACKFAFMTDDVQTGCTIREMVSFTQEDKWRRIHRLCQFKRTPPWEGTLAKLYDEIKIKYAAVVEWTNEVEVSRTVDSLYSQVIKPSKLILVCYQRNGREAYDFAQNCGLPWKVTEIVNDLEDWRDDIILKNPSQFYMFIKAGYKLRPDYFSELNDKIHFEDLRFAYIKSDNLLIIPRGLYTMLIKPLRKILEEETGMQTLNENLSPTK